MKRPSLSASAIAVLIVVAVCGCMVGWWAGSAEAACHGAQDCFLDVPLFEALGTWVAGVGTVAALVFAGRQLAGDIEARVDEAARRDLETQQAYERAVDEAQLVSIDVTFPSHGPYGITSVAVTITNRANATSIYKVKGICKYGNIPPRHEVNAGEFHQRRFHFDGAKGIRVADEEAHRVEVLESTTIEWQMNGHDWKRTGSGPPSRAR